MEPITLRKFLREKTKVHELCAIQEHGYIVAVVYIDHEDLSSTSIPERLLNMTVKTKKWGFLPVIFATGVEMNIPCHNVEVGE